MGFETLEAAAGDGRFGETGIQAGDPGLEGARADPGRLGMDDEEGFELPIPEEFANQGHHAAVRLEWIGRGEAEHFEANTLSEPRGFGERTYRQPSEDPIGLFDEVLGPSEHVGDDVVAALHGVFSRQEACHRVAARHVRARGVSSR
jgi:hypothetical protein